MRADLKRWQIRRRNWMLENPEYMSWDNMKNRCYNKNDPKWLLYGGRGIRVCEKWKQFSHFLADMGRRPGKGYTLERLNNDGNYEPGNCKWATRQEQARNRRSTRWVMVGGRRISLAEAADAAIVKYDTLMARLNRDWDTRDAMLTPVGI